MPSSEGKPDASSRANGRWPNQRISRGVQVRPVPATSKLGRCSNHRRAVRMTILLNLQKLFTRDDVLAEDRQVRGIDAENTSNVVEFGELHGVAAQALAPRTDQSSHEEAMRPTALPAGRSGRVRTRLLPEGDQKNGYSPAEGSDIRRSGRVRRPVAWLVIIEGPGTGDWFVLESGLTHIGCGAEQEVCLDFGDQNISRENHAFITYDIAQHRFQISHGDSVNRTRLNDVMVDGKVELSHGDRIVIGKTTLRIVTFCDDKFSWPPIIDKGGSE